MPRDLSALKALMTAQDVLDFLNEDPHDRVYVHTIDLSPDEWINGVATRTDDGCYVVMSMRAIGARTIDDFVNIRRAQQMIGSYGAMPGELAVVGHELNRDRFGRTIPDDIKALHMEAEEMPPGYRLAWADYEGLCVLRGHPALDKAASVLSSVNSI